RPCLATPHNLKIGRDPVKKCLAGLYASQTNRPKLFTSFKDKDEDVNPAALTTAFPMPALIDELRDTSTDPNMRALKSKTKRRKTYLPHLHAATERFGITLVVGFELSWRTCQPSVLKSLNSE
ncbi:MAG: hypothetical protein M3Z49_11660, partial [Bifidobacteriales bacterium]|nr:hypothetical protein [Bifidobacteriales bacterium]